MKYNPYFMCVISLALRRVLSRHKNDGRTIITGFPVNLRMPATKISDVKLLNKIAIALTNLPLIDDLD